MYLKSIEIQGFKSFANKMKFEFQDGITGIVGPNGSGKSNIGDAVRWVLGEQSAKQLRGAKMEDVIFSGTEARRPLGFAYVALTLDNSDHLIPIDYQEVTVARRVYRSGESEYQINGNNCRLKDVQELFFDTGIGKEGYSIIGQGQVDKILSTKPEDRRELFDEAAGISKFKKRKAQAEKQLEQEHQNLSRVNDILRELDSRIEPLEKQSKEAKEFLAYSAEKKNLDVAMFLHQYDKNDGIKKELEEKLAIATEDYEGTQKEFNRIRAEYQDVEDTLETYEKGMEEKRTTLTDTRLKVEALKGQIQVMEQEIAGAKQSEEHLKNRMESAAEEVRTREEELSSQEQNPDYLKEQKEALEQSKQKQEQEIAGAAKGIEQLESEINARREESLKLLGNESDAKVSLERQYSMREQNTKRWDELREQLSQGEDELQHLNQEAEKITGQVQEYKSKMARYEVSNETVTEELEQAKTDWKKKEPLLEKAREELQRGMIRLENIRNMAERYEGYGNSIRRVMEQKKTHPGILGVVADLLHTKKEYETAMEVALGGNIQNIVTDKETTAKEMIQFLKENKFGRGTFLPLDHLVDRGNFQPQEAKKETGVVGVAAELVTAQKEYQTLISYLLGRILVVDTLEHALAIGKKYQQSLRMVTLEGELLTPGGAITGGRYQNQSNLLGRSRELEELEKETKAKGKEVKELTQEIQNLEQERKEKEEILEENKEALHTLLTELSVLEEKQKQAENIVAEKQGQLEEWKTRFYALEEEGHSLESQIDTLKEVLGERTKENQSAQESIQTGMEKIEEARKALKVLEDALGETRTKLAAVEQNQWNAVKMQERLREEIEHFKEEGEKAKASLEENARMEEEKALEIKKVTETIEEGQAHCETAQDELNQLILQKNELTTRQKAFFDKREELANQLSGLDKEVYRLSDQLEKLAEQLKNHMDYMWNEYELTYSLARGLNVQVDLDPAGIKKALNEVRGKIKELGNVNVAAIEEYKEVSGRYELMHTQHDDLILAEESLQKIIRDLDDEMRKQFALQFAAIQKEFDVVFKTLFGGGHASLELMEDADILEAGIRIIAQPPGKKLQNMMQLSGGEKALTAIALLFAILNLKPTPFCLLDEIEAALDDSNVNRFAEYLKQLSGETQFIVITHRRGTMTVADVLYGITMQEKGISTMVSVSMVENSLT